MHIDLERTGFGIAFLALMALLTAPSVALSQDVRTASFQDLCAAPGVLKCFGFDDTQDVDPYVSPADDEVIRITLDTTVKASGGGSLQFEIPAFTTSSNAGDWTTHMGQEFGPGGKFYVTFKQRFSSEMLDIPNIWGNGWKQVVFHKKGRTCGNVELATENTYSRGFPQMYTGCGADNFINWEGDRMLLQDGDYKCYYDDRTDCGYYKADQWMTFYYEIEIGAWWQKDSKIRAYMAYEGGPLKQFIDRPNQELGWNEDRNDTFSQVMLTTYSTNRSGNKDHPTAYTWFDELVISTQPIFDTPAVVSVKPAAPSDLTTQ